MAHEIPAFEGAKSFDEIIGEVRPHKMGQTPEFVLNKVEGLRGTETNYLQGYCAVSATGRDPFLASVCVTPTQDVIDYIRNKMITVDADRIYFHVIVYEDRTSRVYAKYNQIIGSRLLAVFDAKETRRFLKGVSAASK
jgi:hypothetical protein